MSSSRTRFCRSRTIRAAVLVVARRLEIITCRRPAFRRRLPCPRHVDPAQRARVDAIARRILWRLGRWDSRRSTINRRGRREPLRVDESPRRVSSGRATWALDRDLRVTRIAVRLGMCSKPAGHLRNAGATRAAAAARVDPLARRRSTGSSPRPRCGRLARVRLAAQAVGLRHVPRVRRAARPRARARCRSRCSTGCVVSRLNEVDRRLEALSTRRWCTGAHQRRVIPHSRFGASDIRTRSLTPCWVRPRAAAGRRLRPPGVAPAQPFVVAPSASPAHSPGADRGHRSRATPAARIPLVDLVSTRSDANERRRGRRRRTRFEQDRERVAAPSYQRRRRTGCCASTASQASKGPTRSANSGRVLALTIRARATIPAGDPPIALVNAPMF